jgi:hypothetical protein
VASSTFTFFSLRSEPLPFHLELKFPPFFSPSIFKERKERIIKNYAAELDLKHITEVTLPNLEYTKRSEYFTSRKYLKRSGKT